MPPFPQKTTKTAEIGIDFAGQIYVDNATIVSPRGALNILDQVKSISLYENIYSHVLTGNILVDDSLNLAELFPLTGHEIIDLIMRTPGLEGDGDVRRKFYLYKMSDRIKLGDKRVAYRLHFISIEGITAINKKISRALSGNIGDILQLLLTDKTIGLETVKNIYIERPPRDVKYISNYWNIIDNIKYLTSLAVNTNGQPYVFFENRDGFHFTSLETLQSNTPYQIFVDDRYVKDKIIGTGQVYKNPEEDFKRINDIKIPESYDYIKRLQSGTFGSRQIGYDVKNHKYTIKDYNFTTDEKTSRMNEYLPHPLNTASFYEAAQMTYLKSNGVFDGYDDITNQEYIQKRKSLMGMLDSNKVIINVPGRLDYTAGQKVILQLPKSSPLRERDDEFIDYRYSGAYIMTAIHHVITRVSHEIHAELSSDTINVDSNPDGI